MREKADEVLGDFFWPVAIAVVFIVIRQISPRILVSYQIDKFAHLIVSFCLAASAYPFVVSLYRTPRVQKIFARIRWRPDVKALVFALVLAAAILWEIAEYIGIKPVMYYGIPGMRSGGWDYAIDTMVDMLMNMSGAIWCLYLIPELSSASGPSS